jgi:hypothetical protein
MISKGLGGMEEAEEVSSILPLNPQFQVPLPNLAKVSNLRKVSKFTLTR